MIGRVACGLAAGRCHHETIRDDPGQEVGIESPPLVGQCRCKRCSSIGAMTYEIVFATKTREHIAALTAREQRIVFTAIRSQLSQQPKVESRNRKQMRPNPLATWELRVGTLRVFYDVDGDTTGTVTIVAVGRKDRNRILIGGQEFEL